LQSAVITPNGDGVNDVVRIEYDLLNVRTVPVSIEVFNLAGHKVAEIIDGERTSGRFRTVWDGRGADGELMPPGTYLLRLVVETDQGEDLAQRIVGMAY
jgi:flagellar hook assembly protein FlgD